MKTKRICFSATVTQGLIASCAGLHYEYTEDNQHEKASHIHALVTRIGLAYTNQLTKDKVRVRLTLPEIKLAQTAAEYAIEVSPDLSAECGMSKVLERLQKVT